MGATVSARTLREAMTRYLEALRAHREEIDSLNVFPVPDGDTGTNMLMTQQAVHDALDGLDGAQLAEVGEAISRAALMGARGNSGVILSQVLRGLCGRLGRATEPSPTDLAEALAEASAEARRAVAEPVEGTMLSVIRDAARAAGKADGDVAAVAEAALEEGLRAVERTRDQLPELTEAGVVDAGGKGLVLLLDALVSAIAGVPLRVEVGPRGPVGERREATAEEGDEERYGYEVMFLLEGEDDVVPGLRQALGAIGDSLVVVGGGGLWNVHVHTDDPGAAVERGIDAGRPRQVRITSLDEQVESCLADEARALRAGGAPEEAEAEPHPEPRATALVATAPGKGAARLFRSLGAVVVPGGPGQNPSVADLVEAIERAPSRAVVVLPNHKNIVPAAERAATEPGGKRVVVVPTRSVPAGLAAAAAFNPEAAVEENEGYVREGAEAVAAAEVATAVRDADTPAGPVTAGQLLGVVGGEVRVVGEDPVEIATEVVRGLVRDEHEVLTLLLGEDLTDEHGEAAAQALREAFPDLEVDVHRGDQPHYPFLIGLE